MARRKVVPPSPTIDFGMIKMTEAQLTERFKHHFRTGMGLYAPKLDGWLQTCGQFDVNVHCAQSYAYVLGTTMPTWDFEIQLLDSGKRVKNSIYWEEVEKGYYLPPKWRIWGDFGRRGKKQPFGLRMLQYKVHGDDYYWYYDYRIPSGAWEKARVKAVSKPLGPVKAGPNEIENNPSIIHANRVFVTRKGIRVRPQPYIDAAFDFAITQLKRETKTAFTGSTINGGTVNSMKAMQGIERALDRMQRNARGGEGLRSKLAMGLSRNHGYDVVKEIRGRYDRSSGVDPSGPMEAPQWMLDALKGGGNF